MRSLMRRAAFLMTAATGAGVLAAGMVVAGAGPAAAAPTVLYAYAGGSASSPASCPQDTASPPDPSTECSLSQALSLANAGDTIDLATPGGTAHYLGNWTITTPGTSASAPVTIQPASGVSNPALDGNHGSATGCTTAACNGPVLTVGSGEFVALSGITIANGNNTSGNLPSGFDGGGGLYNHGTVTITGCTFTGNTLGLGDGGAIGNGNGGGGTVTVTGCTFTGNSAHQGGAINNGQNSGGGTVTVTASTFSGNTATGDGGAIDNGDGGSGTVTVTGSTFTGNSAPNGGAIDSGQNSGSGTVTVTASTFSGNTASGDGGAIDAGNGGGSTTVTASTFSGNSANNGGAIANGQNGGTAPLTVTASTFSGNTASQNGGAINNGDSGGSGTATVTASTFSGNTASNDGNTINNGQNSGSGTVAVAGDVFNGSCHQAGGTWTDNGYNAGSDSTCLNGGTGNVTNSSLGLGSLASNGGPTQTMAPLAASPVIGVIHDPTTGLCPATDQRGYTSAANTNCDAGAVQTTGSAPALTTTPNPAKVTLGTSAPPLNDTATLSGGIDPGGTITFTLYDPSNTKVDTETVPVNGSGSYTTPTGYTLPAGAAAGTWQWDAAYSGDAANGPLSDNGDTAEQVTVVAKASPALTTTAGPAPPVVTGTALGDSAVLSGGNNPGGTITFTLTDPAHTTVYTDVVTVNNGNGTYTTTAGTNPGGFTPATAGIYTWEAVYSGDSGNNGYTASTEPQTVLYGFGGFMSPLPKSTLQKSGSSIPVKFRLTNATGQPISPAVAAALAAAGAVKATLTGPTPGATALCTWNTTSRLFQCNIKTPTGLKTGTANPYHITALENVGGGFVQVPGNNPETIFFK